MNQPMTFWKLLLLLLGGLVLLGLGVCFKLLELAPVLADGSLFVGLACTLLAKVLLVVQFIRWARRVNRQMEPR